MTHVNGPDDTVEEQFQRAKAFLMNANKDGISVYDQLTRLMEVLLDENPDNIANDPSRFEEVLTLLQKNSFIQGESTSPANEPQSKPPQELKQLVDNRALFERPAPEVQTTIEQPDPYTTITVTTTKPLTAPSYELVADHNRFWTAAGCGMAEEEAFLVDRSITKLSMEKNLEDVRFVGKIFGLHGNYYIVSSRRYLENGEKVYQEVNTMPRAPRKKTEVPVQPEPGYVGTNRVSYWVTSHPSAAWRILPDVTPQQINAARAIKRLFTGDLDAEVVSSPPFAWSEAVYLRAQLSRIVCATLVAPTGALEEPEPPVDDDDAVDEEEEDGPAKPKEAKYRPLAVRSKEFAEEDVDIAQFVTLDQWVHAESAIRKNGRQTTVPEKPETGDEADEEDDAEQQRDQDEEDEQAEGEGEDENEEAQEEEVPELFAPIRGDDLYCVVDIPQPPPPIRDEEDEDYEEAEDTEHQSADEAPKDNNPAKPYKDEDVPDDDSTKMKMAAWAVRLAGNISTKHRVAVVQSLRWPGAVAYVGENGKRWGCVYFGSGLKKTDFTFTPVPAPPVMRECADIVEIMDPTAAVEKLVRRGEEPPAVDSEHDEADEENEAEGDGPEM